MFNALLVFNWTVVQYPWEGWFSTFHLPDQAQPIALISSLQALRASFIGNNSRRGSRSFIGKPRHRQYINIQKIIEPKVPRTSRGATNKNLPSGVAVWSNAITHTRDAASLTKRQTTIFRQQTGRPKCTEPHIQCDRFLSNREAIKPNVWQTSAERSDVASASVVLLFGAHARRKFTTKFG